ncbi:hypothetical protein AG4045_030248, partial [Apium graveolens]
MDPEAVIFDLSSDEDVGWGQNLGDGDDDCDRVENCKWIQDYFNDDSDDVVVVREFLILDIDATIVDVSLLFDGFKSMTLLHAISGILFISIRICHCYVCDSPAPCLQWGTGISFSDHCHATGKLEFWNQKRDSLKKRRQTDFSVPKFPCTSTRTNPVQKNQSRASTPRTNYHIPGAQVPMSAPNFKYTIPHISDTGPEGSTNFTVAIRHNPSSDPKASINPSVHNNNLQPALTSLQIHNVGNNVLARDRRHTVGSLGPRVNVPTPVFKRRGSSGVALASIQRNDYLNKAQGYKYMRNAASVAAPGNSTTVISTENNTESYNRQSSPQLYMQTVPLNCSASQPRLQRHLSSQPSAAILSIYPVHTQPLLSSQLNEGNVLLNPTSQPQIPSQQAYVGGTVLKPNSSQPQLSSQPIKSHGFGNRVYSAPSVYSQPNLASDGYLNVFQQQNQTSNFEDTSFPDFDLDWVAN